MKVVVTIMDAKGISFGAFRVEASSTLEALRLVNAGQQGPVVQAGFSMRATVARDGADERRVR